MKVVFLDIDGVLNSLDYLRRMPGAFDGRNRARMIDDWAVARLNRLIEASQAKIVISSSWRILNTLKEIQEALVKRGLVGDIIGRTPISYSEPIRGVIHGCARGEEIQEWLDKNPGVEKFVILDDDADMVHLGPFLVRTKYAHGLCDEHVDAALALLV